MYAKEIFTNWLESEQLLITRLAGMVDAEDVLQWKDSLFQALAQIKPGTAFKMLVNIHGFKAVNFDVHKVFRTIIPLTLADYNFRIGYLDLFEDADVVLQKKNNSYCYAVAHTHHDAEKMHLYERECSRPNDRYFVDPKDAENWIRSYGL